MEILQRKRQVNTVNYCFSFIKHQYRFFQKLKEQNNTNMLTVQCSLGSHRDHSMKAFQQSQTLLDSQ